MIISEKLYLTTFEIIRSHLLSLALSARRPSSLKPEPLHEVLSNFTRCKYAQSSDIRLASLFRVAYAANFSGCRPTTIESVEAFDKDVDSIERMFLQNLNSPLADGFNQHFPVISLKWYRLSYACVFLNVTNQPQRMGKVLTWAIEWSSNILIHLAGRNLSKEVNIKSIPTRLEPDPSVVQMMSFAIDHYHVVIAYAAFIIVKSWLSNLTDSMTPPISPGQVTLTDMVWQWTFVLISSTRGKTSTDRLRTHCSSD